jgi:mRNA interferase MazF
MLVHRGEIYYCDLSPTKGCEQGGLRPVLIIQNELGNKHAPTTIVAPLTSRMGKKHLPTHIAVPHEYSNMPADSIVLCEQVRTIDKSRLQSKVGYIDEDGMKKVSFALMVSLGLN